MIEVAGTPEAAWRACPALWNLPVLRPPAQGRLVVVAPHPDDEVLGLGGTLRGWADAHVVAVTAGEASHPASAVLSPNRLAAARRVEQREAFTRLGRPAMPITRLGHPDGHIDEDLLAAQLQDMLRPGDVCAATWRHDGHRDHETVGVAAARAARARGVEFWEYPVWTWHRYRPADPRIPWARARALRLDPAAVAAKARAVQAFATQVRDLGPGAGDAAILPPNVLAHFARDREIVFLDLGPQTKPEPR